MVSEYATEDNMKCIQCDSATINGVPRHEAGCFDGHIDLSTGAPFDVKCKWCGMWFQPERRGQKSCEGSCTGAYYN